MTECQHHQTIIQNYVAGEISHSELESLHRHCQKCVGCRQLVDMHIGLTRAGREISVPTDAVFDAMRERVIMRIAREDYRAAAKSTNRRLPWWDLRGLLHIYPAAGVVMGVVLIALAQFPWPPTTTDRFPLAPLFSPPMMVEFSPVALLSIAPMMLAYVLLMVLSLPTTMPPALVNS